MKRLVPISILVGGVLCLSGCYNDKADKLYPATSGNTTTCDTTVATSYKSDIMPILQAYCYSPGNGCHDATGSSVSTFNYETYAALASNAADGSLVSDINFAPTKGHNSMPKNSTQIPACDIEKITHWVNEGYPNN